MHLHLEQVVRKNKQLMDRHRGETPSYQLRDQVQLATKDIRGLPGSKELNAWYINPYKILHRENKVIKKLNLPIHSPLTHSFHSPSSSPSGWGIFLSTGRDTAQRSSVGFQLEISLILQDFKTRFSSQKSLKKKINPLSELLCGASSHMHWISQNPPQPTNMASMDSD